MRSGLEELAAWLPAPDKSEPEAEPVDPHVHPPVDPPVRRRMRGKQSPPEGDLVVYFFMEDAQPKRKLRRSKAVRDKQQKNQQLKKEKEQRKHIRGPRKAT